MDARDATVWQLVDEAIGEARGLSFDDLVRLAADGPRTEAVERDGERYRRRTQVLVLDHERVGVKVAVDAGGRRPRGERGVVLAPGGHLAPEWTFGNEPARNPFAAGPKVTIAGIMLCVLLLTLFFVLA